MVKIFILIFILCNVYSANCSIFSGLFSKSNSTKVNKEPVYTVEKVSDGDTITLKKSDDSKLVKIRFLCIDAPEKSQGNWGKVSLAKLAELLPPKSEVSLIGSKTDLYGRTVAEVINNKGVNTNKKMAELGLVVWYKFQKGCDDYKDIEAKAKKSKAGVWNDPTFEMPWDYRTRMGIGFRGMKNSTMQNPTSQHKMSYHHSTTLAYNKNSKLSSQQNAWFTTSSSSSILPTRFGNPTSSHHYNLRTRVKKLVR